jgi:hypothetical protein
VTEQANTVKPFLGARGLGRKEGPWGKDAEAEGSVPPKPDGKVQAQPVLLKKLARPLSHVAGVQKTY